jgi:hypothetical protein
MTLSGVATTFLTSILMSGCAYQLGAGLRAMPGGYDKIAVPVFSNLTKEVGLESFFTSAMIEEIERSKMAAVTNKDFAQLILEGTISSIEFKPGAQLTRADLQKLPDRVVLTKEYRIVLKVDMVLRKKSDDKIIWSGSFSGEQRYAAPQIAEPVINSVNALYNHSARYQNAKLLAKDMMSEAHDRMTENF